MVKVLLIGNGGREHAIADALVRGGAELYAFMSKLNPGIAKLCQNRVKVGSLKDFQAMIEFGKNCQFAVIGPEAPLADGATNALNVGGIPVVGPTIECAQLESSKIFTRNLLAKYKIACNIPFKTFPTMDGIKEYVKEIGQENVVVKPDGLTGGKGVKVWGDHLFKESDIYEYAEDIFSKKGRVIIEEKLDGEEFTYMCFIDGKHVVGSPLVQDNKRAFNDDKGPNTGGMGSVSMANHLMPFISKDDVEYARKQMILVIEAVKKETGSEYKGILYGQFMKSNKGIKLIEFNIRFGDPEGMNVLPLMKTSFVTVCQHIIAGTLTQPVDFEQKATVCKYLVPEGYPDSPKDHAEIVVDEEGLKKIGVRLFYASVSEENGKIYTSSSRTIGILGVADSIEDAEKQAEKGCAFVKGPLFHRTDIGTKPLLDRRIQHMKNVEAKIKAKK